MSPRSARPPRTDAPPRWTRTLLGRVALPDRADEVVGDLEEVHRAHVRRHGRARAMLLTILETLDMSVALLRERRDRRSLTRLRQPTTARTMPTVSWLDFKLGLRMFARYPSLTTVAVLAMAFGIATGAGAFQLVRELTLLPLPYTDEDRIVRIENVSTETTNPDSRALHDFELWRERLTAVERLSALHLRGRTIAIDDAQATPIAEAAVSAVAFTLVDARPVLGRPLLPADEEPGAPAVAVLSHERWERDFAADPDIVGRVVRLGGEPTTVVGVMPASFAFFVPQREGFDSSAPQEIWVPFRLRALDYQRGEGPPVDVFGRLAPDATAEDARAELATIAAGAAAEWPDTHARLTPRLFSFATFGGGDGLLVTGTLALSALFLGVLMVVVCGNVALLLFARAATREAEITVRSALGASRGRIVSQLFAEALVLSAVAIVVGLMGASAGLRWAMGVMASLTAASGQPLPPWMDDSLSPTTIAYAVGLAILGAVVAGVLPALKLTGRRAQVNLQRLVGRGSGVRLGGVWTAVIITQVALTVMLVPVAIMVGAQTWSLRTSDQALPAAEYLAAHLAMDVSLQPPATPADAMDGDGGRRYENEFRALERRLTTEPGVTGVTLATRMPGAPHPVRTVQVEGIDHGIEGTEQAQVTAVDADFFDVLGATVLAGRGFTAADAAGDAASRTAVVNESFVRHLLGGRNPVGRRIRYANGGQGEPGEWQVIVGVVRDMAMTIDPTKPHNAGLYLPLAPGGAEPVQLAVRVAGDPRAFTARLHELAAESAPSLRVQRALPLHEAALGMTLAHGGWFRVIVIAGAMALLLTNAGIYAIISFGVSRRTREIGIRVALGADRRRIISAILSRTARHVGIGVVIGGALGTVATFGLSEGGWQPSVLVGGGLLVAYMVVMLGVCLAAGVVPMRRALRIEPTQALAAD